MKRSHEETPDEDREDSKENNLTDINTEPTKKRRNRICFSCGVCRRRKVKVCQHSKKCFNEYNKNRITNMNTSVIVENLVKGASV